jgi:MFS transporter, ACS family, allantoate permease
MSDPEKSIEVRESVTATAADLGIQKAHIADVKGADGVLQYAGAEAIEVEDATNKRLLRRIDWHVLPWLCGLYVLQFLDKGVSVYPKPSYGEITRIN